MSAPSESISAEPIRTNHLKAFRPVLWMGTILLSSGILHLFWMMLTGAEWNGALSLRKPALFGISAGATAWSIAWVMTKLHPHHLDRSLACAIAGGLLLEVGLITLQQWRGVPSHFNRTTPFDAAVEGTMLGLILLVTAGIVWLTLRTCCLPKMDPATAIALRGGMWLLTLSCGLGIVITMLGERNLASGKPPEIWGPAGVLKYPHGIALHAIQTLPALAWLLHKLRVSKSVGLLHVAVWSQVLFLFHALWQAMQGRARFDLDGVGGAILLAAGLLLGVPIVVVARTLTEVVSPLQQRGVSRRSTAMNRR